MVKEYLKIIVVERALEIKLAREFYIKNWEISAPFKKKREEEKKGGKASSLCIAYEDVFPSSFFPLSLSLSFLSFLFESKIRPRDSTAIY